MEDAKLTLYHFLQNIIAEHADRLAFRFRRDKEWKDITYREWNEQIQVMALGLLELGVKPGEKIVHIADNRQEWMVISMAITTIGSVDVPRGTNATLEDLSYIINHAEASILIMENESVYKKLEQNWNKFNQLKSLIIIDGTLPKINGVKTHTLDSIRELGRKALEKNGAEPYHKLGQAVRPGDLATIIYTSGTTGDPKGAMLLHRCLVWETLTIKSLLDLHHNDSAMCYLPPWHIAERLLEMGLISVGASGNFTTIPSMVADLAECKPSLMLAVPRVWEGIYKKIHDNVAKASPVARAVFGFAKSGAIQLTKAKLYIRGLIAYVHKPPFTETLKRIGYLLGFPVFLLWGAFGSLILKKIRNLLGGRVRLAVSAASALPDNVDLFLRACGINLVEAYGMTEGTGVSSFRLPERNAFKTLGPAMTGVEMQLRTEEGQVIDGPGIKGIAWYRGPNIMQGYYKEPKKTKDAIDKDGWLNSGDLLIRTLNDEFVFAGRAKDTIVLLGGENLEPVPIEDRIKQSPYVNQVMAVGQDKKTLGAIITPNVEALKEWAGQNNVTLPEDRLAWNEDANLRALYKKELRSLISSKTGFKSYEQIANFHILHKEFEAGKEMTETMKMKRNVIADMYKKEIDNLYND